MKRPRFYSNSAGLVKILLDRGMTAIEAAEVVGISVDRFYTIMKSDVPISIATAGLLRKAFGNEAIKPAETGIKEEESSMSTKTIVVNEMTEASTFIQQAVNEAEGRGQLLTQIVYNLPMRENDETRIVLIFKSAEDISEA